MEEIIEDVKRESAATGRSSREILEAMRDEGYIDCDEEGLEGLVKLRRMGDRRSRSTRETDA